VRAGCECADLRFLLLLEFALIKIKSNMAEQGLPFAPIKPVAGDLAFALYNMAMRPGIDDAAGPPTHVSVKDGYLIFRFERPGGDYNPPGVSFRPDLLRRFISIRDEEELLHFACGFGPLGLCKKHGLPMTHAIVRSDSKSPHPWCRDDRIAGRNRNTIREKIGHWGYYINAIASVLSVTAKLQHEEMPAPVDLESWPLNEQQREVAVKEPWSAVIHAVNYWLYRGCFFRFRAKHGLSSRVVVDLACVPPLFGYLTLQLAAEINRGEFLFCDYCGDSYRAERKPNPNRRHFCPRCREKRIPARLAEQDSQAFLRQNGGRGARAAAQSALRPLARSAGGGGTPEGCSIPRALAARLSKSFDASSNLRAIQRVAASSCHPGAGTYPAGKAGAGGRTAAPESQASCRLITQDSTPYTRSAEHRA